MNPTPSQIMAHLENGPLYLRDIAKIFNTPILTMRQIVFQMWEDGLVKPTSDGKYGLSSRIETFQTINVELKNR